MYDPDVIVAIDGDTSTCPRIQLPGNGFGQNGSGWNFGTPSHQLVVPWAEVAAAQ